MQITIIDLKRKDYTSTLKIQRKLQKLRIDNKIDDVLIMVEHNPVLTMGTRGKMTNVIAPEPVLKEKGIDIAWIERGGDVTYHGPGQIVGYPIINLENFDKDLRQYVGRLQETIINVLSDKFDIIAEKRSGVQTGVWVNNEKIAAIGIHVSKWITIHGFAFNVNTDMSHFGLIIPCGLDACGVTSVEKLTSDKQDFEALNTAIEDEFVRLFDYSEVKRTNIEEFFSTLNIDLADIESAEEE